MPRRSGARASSTRRTSCSASAATTRSASTTWRQRPGISKALIYEHFRSKQELYGELMNRAALEMLDRIVAAGSAPGTMGSARLEQGAEAGFSFVTEKPEAFQMFVRDVTDPEVAQQQAALRRGAVAAMVGLMEMEPPETRVGLERRNLEQLAEMVVGGFYALGDWWLRNRDADVSELISMMLSFMWLGLGPHAGRRAHGLPVGRRERASRMQNKTPMRVSRGPAPPS